jgi:hypothetical protein
LALTSAGTGLATTEDAMRRRAVVYIMMAMKFE